MDHWRAEVNGAEICRGDWQHVTAEVARHTITSMQARERQPLGFHIRISPARTAHVPLRQRVTGEAREQQVEEEIQREQRRNPRYRR